jgi:squalene-hopene/tetraprenyl-beta-curcumene cyclase
VRALSAWDASPHAVERGLAFLRRTQRDDGAWLPLWFGSQHTEGHTNPVYGTARVLPAWRDVGLADEPAAVRGVRYLLDAQSESGAWGGDADTPPSMEETALAVAALAGWPEAEAACLRGAEWLADRVMTGGLDHPAPIGLYFAQLWYSEELYPTIWTVAALDGVLRQ